LRRCHSPNRVDQGSGDAVTGLHQHAPDCAGEKLVSLVMPVSLVTHVTPVTLIVPVVWRTVVTSIGGRTGVGSGGTSTSGSFRLCRVSAGSHRRERRRDATVVNSPLAH